MSLNSMTGFALVSRAHPAGTVFLEIRSVNARFLEPQFRIGEELRAAENSLREAFVARLSRGKIDCRFYIHRGASSQTARQINSAMLDQLAKLEADVRSRLHTVRPLSVAEVLQWPGVLEDREFKSEDVIELAKALAAEALDQLIDARRREGEKLGAMILDRVAQMEAIVERLTPLIPQLTAAYQRKLVARLQDAIGIAPADEAAAEDAAGEGNSNPKPQARSYDLVLTREQALDRIRQEVTLYGVRIDVAEELSRLAAHLGETRSILDAGGAVGKRLDFMMQELNREANTLGSKSAAAELADAAMEFKLLIEQMREQVQNIE